jgi:hypothetical protein
MKKKKIGHGSEMGALHQDRLEDWPLVVVALRVVRGD